MPDASLDLVVKLKADVAAGFESINSGLKSVQKNAAETQKSASGFNDKMATMAGAVDLTAKKMAGLGEAAGLPAGPLRALSDVADLAEVGFSNLTKSAVGFNAASVGVAGAGLAIGTAIGSWLNTFPAVRSAVDGLRDSLLSLVNAQTAASKAGQAMAGMSEFQAQMAKSNEEAVQRQIESMKRGGASMEEILAVYGKGKPVLTGAKKVIEDLADAHKKSEEATKRHSAEARRLAEEFEKGTAKATVEHYQKLADEAEKKLTESMKKTLAKLDAEAAAGVSNTINQHLQSLADDMLSKSGSTLERAWKEFWTEVEINAAVAGKESGKGFSESFAGIMEGLPAVIIGAIQGGGDIGKAIGAHLGGSLATSLTKDLGGSLGKMLGSIAGPLGTLLGGGLGKVFGSLFGGEGKETNKLRDQFIAAAGGLHELNVKAQAAGVNLNALLAAKDKAGLQTAIDQLNAAFGVTDQATQKLNAAMQEYGITVGEMGPKFAQQQLNEQAAGLVEKYKLLTAAGADHNLVLEKMGPNLVDYVNQARQAGVSIPEDMRKVVEELLAQGKLLDENGEAFESAEEAGITFGASLQDSMSKAAEQMERLVEAISRLYGLGEINIPVKVHPNVGAPGGPGEHAEHFPSGGAAYGTVPAFLHGTPSAPEWAMPHAKLKELVDGAVAAAVAATGGSQPGGFMVGPIIMDGAAVSRGVMLRQDQGFGRSRRPTRRR